MKRLSPIFLVLIMFACSSTQITYDVDSSVDFTKFKTYAFTPEVATLPIQELNRNRIIAAVEKELAARGLSKSDNPDVLVDLQVKAAQKQEAVTTGGGYGYRWGGGMQTTQINNYVEGSLFVNMISKNNLVWQGRAVKTLDDTSTPQQREQNINYAVAQIFTKYPVKPK